MSDSNFAELRRVRSEMSCEAGHDVRRFIELLSEVRRKYRDQLVNHGADAECGSASALSNQNEWDRETVPIVR